MSKAMPLAVALAAASLCLPLAPVDAQAGVLTCVQRSNGSIRILEPNGTCPSNSYLLELGQPQEIPPPPTLHTIEIIGTTIPGTWSARAFCPQGWKVTGGGGTTLNLEPLAGSFPIATTDGVFASDGLAIGYQATAAVEAQVYAWVICSRVF